MKNINKNLNFIEQIAHMLEPMYEVVTEESEQGYTLLLKNGLQFGYVKNNQVFLANTLGSFTIVPEKTLQDADRFLFAATNAYWIASGKKTSKITKNIFPR